MKKVEQFLFNSFVPFSCGGVFVMNLSVLIGSNPNYNASWWKVAIALVLFILVPIFYNSDQ